MRIHLTARAWRLRGRLEEAGAAVNSAALAGLDQDEATGLMELIGTLIRNLDFDDR